VEVADLLLTKGADLDSRSKSDITPLFFAASEGLTDMVRLLISRGADVNISDIEGLTPLAAAIAHGHTDTADVIRASNKIINTQGKADVSSSTYTKSETQYSAGLPSVDTASALPVNVIRPSYTIQQPDIVLAVSFLARQQAHRQRGLGQGGESL
jgi:ankyrin repeat protein